MTEPSEPGAAPDYRRSLNVPKPDVKNPDGLDTNPDSIPQRAGLAKREPMLLEFWRDRKIYEQSLRPTTSQGTFVLHDGPPFSNGDIHIGHAFNKILKDVATRYHSMLGAKAPYVPGWDNNGLPIEVLVAKEFREKGQSPTRLEIRRRCREVAEHWYKVQSEQFQRLGIRGEWNRPYLTMSTDMAARELDVFADLVEKGYIYRGLRPVYWSLVDETALADAEIEYAERTDPSVYVRFPLRADPDRIFGHRADPARCFTIIWTTTPWTIPANTAVAVGPSIEYVVVEHGGDRYLVAAERLEATMAAVGIEGWRKIGEARGQELERMLFQHPLFDRVSPLVLADYVTTTDGTGVVHTAPGHGKEDFQTGQKYNLDTIQVLTGDGHFNDDAGAEFAGLRVMAFDRDRKEWASGPGQTRVLERLSETGALLARTDIVHSYPHGWRSHDPLVYRATVQWFMSIEHNGHRDRCLRAIEGIDWTPEESKNRIKAMVATRPDWCISRQRAWGVGIPVFYAQPSGTPLLTGETIRMVRDYIAVHGTDSWFECSVADILPAGFRHPETGETEWTKEQDIFDVWFDSGSTCRTVLEHWPGLSYPADVYLEGGDQHRGWFNSSLMIGVASTGHAPYRRVVTNGWTLDENGHKMSKSKMNGVAPRLVAEKYGADVLRLWVCSTDYFGDVRVGDAILEQTATQYRTVRNTLKYMLGNLYDFDSVLDAVPYAKLDAIDRWALHRVNEIVRHANQQYAQFEFYKVAHSVLDFCTNDLSAFYLDVLKDRLYTSGARSDSRRSAQTALFEILSCLTRLLAPILPFTAEEVWQKMRVADGPGSVQLAAFPSERVPLRDTALARQWEPLIAARDAVNRALEGVKKRGELAITLLAGPDTYAALHDSLANLAALFLVSSVTLERSAAPGLAVRNDGPAAGVRCARCWIAVDDGGDDPALFCAVGLHPGMAGK